MIEDVKAREAFDDLCHRLELIERCIRKADAVLSEERVSDMKKAFQQLCKQPGIEWKETEYMKYC